MESRSSLLKTVSFSEKKKSVSGRIESVFNLEEALMSSYLFFLTFVYFCCIIPFIEVCMIIPVLVKPFQFVVNLLSF